MVVGGVMRIWDRELKMVGSLLTGAWIETILVFLDSPLRLVAPHGGVD